MEFLKKSITQTKQHKVSSRGKNFTNPPPRETNINASLALWDNTDNGALYTTVDMSIWLGQIRFMLTCGPLK